MPELPEVEALRLGLEKKIVNKKILKIKVLKPKIVYSSGTVRRIDKKKVNEFINGVINKKIKSIKRLAKNLIIYLNDDSVLVIHLKMTGQLVFVNNKKEKTFGGHPINDTFTKNLPNKHTCIIFELDSGILYYNDIRMFGYVLYYKNILEAKRKGHFKNIGLEPFDKNFTLTHFKKELKNKKKNIKSVLLDQSIVNGAGNIYSDEICFASHVLPSKSCASLSDKEMTLIYNNLKKILSLAIAHGGSSISDYLLADGSRGNYARLHKVYGRAGEKCKVCKNILQKIIVAGRTTVYCTNCQK
jgi:formamidopyrimidine-DNA glycosylase